MRETAKDRTKAKTRQKPETRQKLKHTCQYKHTPDEPLGEALGVRGRYFRCWSDSVLTIGHWRIPRIITNFHSRGPNTSGQI